MSLSSDSDECRVLSGTEEDEADLEDDPHNSGLHVNDTLNVRDPEGRVLVNLARPGADPDVYLADQLASCVKPHQVTYLFQNQLKSCFGFHCSYRIFEIN